MRAWRKLYALAVDGIRFGPLRVGLTHVLAVRLGMAFADQLGVHVEFPQVDDAAQPLVPGPAERAQACRTPGRKERLPPPCRAAALSPAHRLRRVGRELDPDSSRASSVSPSTILTTWPT